MLDKNGIAKRISKEVKPGYYVNLGIGIPTLVANFVSADIEVDFQSENGIFRNSAKAKATQKQGHAAFHAFKGFLYIFYSFINHLLNF